MNLQFNITKTSEDFKLVYPEITLLPFYKDLSKIYNATTLSKVLHSLLLSCHPDSPFYNHPEKDTYILKTTNLLKDYPKLFEEAHIKESLLFLEECFLTEAQRALNIWNNKLRERRLLFQELSYSVTDMKLNKSIDDMLAIFPKLMTDYQNIVDKISIDKNRVHNTKPQSALDDNLI